MNLLRNLINPFGVTTSFNLNVLSYLPSYFSKGLTTSIHTANETIQPTSSYSVTNSSTLGFSEKMESALQENTTDSRFKRSMNAIFKYDFKVGNYMPDNVKSMNPHLFMTIKDVTTGLRKSS
jgi:hypothetical protein